VFLAALLGLAATGGYGQGQTAPMGEIGHPTSTSLTASLSFSTYGQTVKFTVVVGAVGLVAPAGTVEFLDPGITGTLGPPVTLTAIEGTVTSQAELSTSTLTVGPHGILAIYQGNGSNAGSQSAVLPFTVEQAATRFAFFQIGPGNSTPVGNDVILQAGINFPGQIPPSGTVLFEDTNRGITIGFANVESSPGQAQVFLITDSLNAGTYNVTATYQGDKNYVGCKSTTSLPFTISQGTAAFTLTSNNPSTVGQPVTFTAFYNSGDAPPPSGSVTFKDGTSTLDSVPLSLGLANYTTSALSAGTHSITVVYGGDSNYNGSTSAVLTQTVNSAKTTATQTTLTSSLNPSLIGQPVNLTATVSGSGGTPTGTVTFKDGSTVIVSGVALTGGMATYQDPSLSAGTHSLTAVYSGDSNYSSSNSAKLSQTVYSSSPATTTKLTSSPNPSAPGQAVTFTATVTTSGPGTPSGIVTWWDGTTELGSFALNGNSASLTTSTLSLGTHSITANYGGDAVFAASTSAVLTQKVSNTTTTTTTTTSLMSSLNPSTVDQSVTFTATVTPDGSGTPTGSVTFKDGGATLGSGNLSGGEASYSTSSLSAGTHSITAVYGGDTNFSGSTSSALSQKVNSASSTGGTTSTSLSSSPNPATAGQAVTFTATVTPNGSGTPTGSVSFEDGSTMLGRAELSGGQASYTTSSLSVGPHSITASYGGDANFSSSTSETLTETITSGSSGSATYHFAHLAFGGGWQITLTYVNYGPQSASCQTTFYSDSGKALNVPFTDITASTRTDHLAGGADIHVQTQWDGNTSLLTGWAEAQCTAPVKASLLYRLIANGVAQGEAGVNAMTALATEFVSFAQTATGVAYANPSAEPANVTLTVLDVNGNQLGSKTITLQPNQHGAANIGPMLELGSFTGSVQIVSTQPIAVLLLNAEAYPVFSSLPPADLPAGALLAGTGAADASSTPSTYYFAHLAFGGGWQTTLTYVNYGPQSTTCQTTFYSDAGDPLNVPFADETNSTRTDNLAGGAEVHVQTQSAEGGALSTGWAKAECTGPVKASLLYRLITNGVAKGEAGVNAMTAPANEFVSFAQTATGVAYANPSGEAANVTLTVLDVNGNELGTKTITLQPSEHGAANIGPMLGLGSFAGSVQIVSTQPIVAVLLNAETYPVFSSLPPADLPPGTALAGQQ